MNALVVVTRILYIASLLAVTWRLLPSARRALDKTRVQEKDLDYLLFWGLAFNRLFFVTWTIAFFQPTGRFWDAGLLIACYLFGAALEFGVIASKRWQEASRACRTA